MSEWKTGNYKNTTTMVNNMNEEIIGYISEMVDSLDKLINVLKKYNDYTREQDIAIQKLEEAVFWLTYGMEEEND